MTKTSDVKYHYAVGRRKRATARAKYYPSSKELEITVNKKPLIGYFEDYYAKTILNACTQIGLTTGRVDFFINGGGISAQSEAARLALAKSMLKENEGNRPLLRTFGLLTTDIRKVLPKRPGLRKNRKKEQWSKR